MTAAAWSAKQYTIFEGERTRPVRDLLAAIPGHEVQSAVDIGCGPGNSTEVLALWFPEATITGFDPDADMIAAARKRLPSIVFTQEGVEHWNEPGPFDVILANAVFQWVPDHAALFPRLIDRLSPGGSLAVQMPDNLDQPTHLLMREVAEQGPWANKLAGIARPKLPAADTYYSMLKPYTARIDIWRTVYHHPLSGGAKDVVEWLKGSGLRPYLAPLSADEQDDFLARYTDAIAKAYPVQDDGTILLPFPRLFIVATR